SFPVDGVLEVVQGLRSDVYIRRVAFLREQNGFRNGNPQLRRDRVVEVFVVGGPPERIVDDVGSLKDCVLQEAAVVFDLVRDAIQNAAIARGLDHARAAQLDEIRGDAVLLAELIDLSDEGRRKGILTSAKQSDNVHGSLPEKRLDKI